MASVALLWHSNVQEIVRPEDNHGRRTESAGPPAEIVRPELERGIRIPKPARGPVLPDDAREGENEYRSRSGRRRVVAGRLAGWVTPGPARNAGFRLSRPTIAESRVPPRYRLGDTVRFWGMTARARGSSRLCLW